MNVSVVLFIVTYLEGGAIGFGKSCIVYIVYIFI